MNVGDPFWCLVWKRIKSRWSNDNDVGTLSIGLPFGSSMACAIANLFLHELDMIIDGFDGCKYSRYADDILVLSKNSDINNSIKHIINNWVISNKLKFKESHTEDGPIDVI